MFLEMFLAVLSLLTGSGGRGRTNGFVGTAAKPGYVLMVRAGKNAGIFAAGLSQMMARIGVPTSFGLPYGSVFLTLMGLTIMYLVCALCVWLSRVWACGAAVQERDLWLDRRAGAISHPDLDWLLGAHLGAVWWAANQLMASLAFAVGYIVVDVKGEELSMDVHPLIFMFVNYHCRADYHGHTVWISVFTQKLAIDQLIGNILSGSIAYFLVVAALILAWDALKAFQRYRAEMAKAPPRHELILQSEVYYVRRACVSGASHFSSE